MEQLAQWDNDLFVWLNGLGTTRWDDFWLFVTHIKNWIPLYVLFFVLFLIALSRKRAFITTLFTLITMASALAATSLVKNTVGRLRPSNTLDLVERIRVLETPLDYSFWSGHAAVSFAITIFVVLVLRSWSRWIYLIFIWPLLFTISRIFVGVHYPSDLLVGAIVGSCIGYICYTVYPKNLN